jgi:transcriptional regulator with XRE-family HTH domain
MQSQGEILKLAIRGTGLSQDEAATAMGMTRQNLGLYFHRDALPPTLIKLVNDKLNIDILSLQNAKNAHNNQKNTPIAQTLPVTPKPLNTEDDYNCNQLKFENDNLKALLEEKERTIQILLKVVGSVSNEPSPTVPNKAQRKVHA